MLFSLAMRKQYKSDLDERTWHALVRTLGKLLRAEVDIICRYSDVKMSSKMSFGRQNNDEIMSCLLSSVCNSFPSVFTSAR